ncbi:MAG: transcription factor S [Fervidicoccaceae archaeon]
MKFCPKCGTLMQPRRINGVNYLVCPKCGYKEEVSSSQPTYKVANKIKHTVREKSIVIENDKIPETLPKLKDVVYCPKCGHNEVYYWTMQTRAADEPPTRFYKCAKCGHVWREYE